MYIYAFKCANLQIRGDGCTRLQNSAMGVRDLWVTVYRFWVQVCCCTLYKLNGILAAQ